MTSKGDKAGAEKLPAARAVTRAPSPAPTPFAQANVWQSAGNLAVQRFLQGGRIQAKLAVGVPDDPLEKEADRVAEAVIASPRAVGVQRKCASCVAGGQCASCAEDETLHAKESPGHTPRITPGVESSVASLRGGGEPLPASARAFFEPRLESDLSQVRVHTGGAAAESAREINALAYTVGRDVVFAAGRYAPESGEGKKLLAHELTHVLQQTGGTAASRAAADSGGGSPLRRQPDPAAEPNQTNAPPEPNQSQAPQADASPTSTQVASKSDRNSAQERLLKTSGEIRDQVVATSFWIASQWSRFIAETTSSPLRSWNPGILTGSLAAAGIIAGMMGSTKITVAFANMGGIPAALAGFVLSSLVKAAAGKIADAITGKPPTDAEIRTDERKRTGEAAVRKLSEINIDTASALAGNDVYISLVHGKLSEDISTEDLNGINNWIDQQSADAQARPQGDSLYLALLERWAYDQADTAADPKYGVDPAQWKEANKTLFGTETMPRKHFYLHQLRNVLETRGVPTDTVDGWIADPSSSPTGANDASMGGNSILNFDHAADPKVFADSMYAADTPQHKHIAAGKPFRGLLQFGWNARARMGFENLGLMENIITETHFTVDLIEPETPAGAKE
jgi:hypothetical protein